MKHRRVKRKKVNRKKVRKKRKPHDLRKKQSKTTSQISSRPSGRAPGVAAKSGTPIDDIDPPGKGSGKGKKDFSSISGMTSGKPNETAVKHSSLMATVSEMQRDRDSLLEKELKQRPE